MGDTQTDCINAETLLSNFYTYPGFWIGIAIGSLIVLIWLNRREWSSKYDKD